MKDGSKDMQNEEKEIKDITETGRDAEKALQEEKALDEEKALTAEEAGSGKKKKKRRIGPAIWVLLAALMVVFIFSTYHFVSEFMAYKKARDEYKGLSSYISIAQGAGTDAAAGGADKDATGGPAARRRRNAATWSRSTILSLRKTAKTDPGKTDPRACCG